MQKLLFFLTIFGLSTACNRLPKKQPDSTQQGAAVIGCMPKTTDKAWYTAGTKAPLLTGLEGIDFNISTNNKEAQAYFNQGMMLAYGFNHAEAARSFLRPAGWTRPALWPIGALPMCWALTTTPAWKKIITSVPTRPFKKPLPLPVTAPQKKKL
ncbi:hypothetical protein LWM68_25360 [Niabella sp. W65]|nr:hypothetical protein [Niabella sp. W65]MCH7365797.1 hypothetical protein [Niabella sp. W65]